MQGITPCPKCHGEVEMVKLNKKKKSDPDMVPEPSTWLLMALGVFGLGYVRSQRKRQLPKA